MTDLNSLVVFASVVTASSFSEAGRRLRIPTSTVSRRVAELENQLGVRLLERSTRRLRLTEAGEEVLHHAQQSVLLQEAVSDIASNYGKQISGTLRLSAPPSLSDSILVPLIRGFQEMHPDVRISVLVTERATDHIADGVDLIFQCGGLKDSSLVGRRLLSYRHQLMAAPEYLKRHGKPRHPNDLLRHRIVAFARWKPSDLWIFENARSKEVVTLHFEPHLAMNDYSGILPALLAGMGVGDVPPIVQSHISRKNELVEVMPQWRFKGVELWLFHAGNRHTARPVRAFLDYAAREVKKLFPQLPR